MRYGGVLLLLLLSCGEDAGVADGGLCPVHDNPTFELGTGQDRFLELVDSQDLKMTAGPQGGCHFWLAFRTDGFSENPVRVEYQFSFADTGRQLQLLEQFVRLGASGAPSLCERAGFTAFVLMAPDLRDQRITIRVTLEDDRGRRLEQSKTIWARWPEPAPGQNSDALCSG